MITLTNAEGNFPYPARLPIKLWANDPAVVLDQHYKDAFLQAANLANHPLAWKWVALMPDFHPGFGMPIGGVLATEGGIIPNAVGVDIGCGMVALDTGLTVQGDGLDREVLRSIQASIYERVPVGTAHHKTPRPLGWTPEIATSDLPIIKREFVSATFQVGTLGGGNHFIEVQRNPLDDHAWVMIHSGSRNVGLKVCQHYHKRALELNHKWRSALPDDDLAFLPEGLPEWDEYLESMRWCMVFAEASRHLMLAETLAAFGEAGRPVELGWTKTMDRPKGSYIETHHNFVALEHRLGRDVWVHRKGAVEAKGWVTIPGSMGTGSYIGRGLDEAQSYGTCSHGAGRIFGRREANRLIGHDEAVAAMAHVVYGVRQGSYDEMPMAYKDIDDVMAAQRDLVEPTIRLEPLMVVKG